MKKLQPLIDADVLLYEIGFGSETGWRSFHPDSEDPPPFEYVKEMLEGRIEEIKMRLSEVAEELAGPVFFLTGKNNFREEVAKKKKYKGNRAENSKPFHYHNIKGYIKTVYETFETDGFEADDALAIAQTNGYYSFLSFDCPTVICTRDKDLRQVPGWHFGWELGRQPQYGPLEVDQLGHLVISADGKKLSGTGDKFFFAQMLMGDPVDNIPGLPNNGPRKAYNALSDLQTYEEMEKVVSEAYRAFYGDSWKEEMEEQAKLVWMVRELDEEGKPIMWRLSEREI